MFGNNPELLEEAILAVADCDTVIAAVGGTSSRFAGGAFNANGALKQQLNSTMDCGENVDDCHLRLPGSQLALLKALHDGGKRVVTVIIGGRPYEMWEIDAYSDAIVCAFYPGVSGGEAIAKLIFGEIQPAGRLSVTLPDHVGQLPVYYNAKDSYRPGAYYNADSPRYRFGCGLSYTDFSYELLTGNEESVTFRVSNTGSRPGWAVPQLYLHRIQGAVTSRVRQLCGFAKVYLQPGEVESVTIAIPRESLAQWDSRMVSRILPGKVAWFLCDSGEEKLTGVFVLGNP